LFLHEPRALRHQPESVLETKHPRHRGGDILSKAVPNHRGGGEAPRHPETGERIIDGEYRRLREPSLPELLGSDLRILGPGIEKPPEIETKRALQKRRAPVHFLAEQGLGLIKLPSHVDVLGSLPREQEHHPALPLGNPASENAPVITRAQELNSVPDIFGGQSTTVRESLAPLVKRKCHLRQIRVGMGPKEISKVVGGCLQGSGGFGR
jgi:hypothetical protein